LWACSEDEIPNSGQDYFPLSPGFYRVYEVTRTVYLDKEASVENYQLRERILQADSRGDVDIYLMTIERRDTENDAWQAVQNIRLQRSNKALN
jgi:hypothetical protein